MTEEESRSALDTKGTVTMELKDFLQMRDLLETLLDTTDTHKEFIVKFRKSLVQLITKAKEAGIDLDPLFDYYSDLKFGPIENVKVVQIKALPTSEDQTPKWTVLLTKKIEEDEGIGTFDD